MKQKPLNTTIGAIMSVSVIVSMWPGVRRVTVGAMTSTNDKKADEHDWRHRFMPGDSRPSQQSPLLCTAK